MSLAFLLRYGGIALVLAAIPLLIALSHLPLRRRLSMVLAYTGIAVAPCALWMALNMHLTGTPIGDRPPAGYSVHSNMVSTGYTMANWFNPLGGSDIRSLRIGGAVPMSIVLGGWLVHLLARGRRYAGADGSVPLYRNPLVYLYVMVVYVGFTLMSASMTAVDVLSNRYLAPAYPLLLVALALHLDHVVSDYRGGWSKHRQQAIVLCLCGLVALTIPIRPAHISLGWLARGASGVWGDADQVQLETDLSRADIASVSGTVYSKNPWLLFYLTGIRSQLAPRQHPYRSQQTIVDDVQRLAQAARQSSSMAILVRFHDLAPSHLIPLDELEEQFILDPHYEGPTLNVYEIRVPG